MIDLLPLFHTALYDHFEINALKKQASVRQARNEKLATDEVACLNIEVRSAGACLRELHAADEAMQEKELRDMGMAFVQASVGWLFQRCAGGLERRWMLCRCTTPNVRARGGPRAPLLCLLKSVGEPPSLAG